MEDPIFYSARPAGKKISPRQEQAILKKIIRLEREAERLNFHALALSKSCQKIGIAAPDFSSYAFKQWGSLLRGLQVTLLKIKNTGPSH